MKKLSIKHYALLAIATLLVSAKGLSQSHCFINEINRAEASYDTPCEGEGVVVDAIRYHIANGNVTWSRVGAAMPASAYTYQDQLYIYPYYNEDAGQYLATFTDNTTGCRDTAYVDLMELVPIVEAQIHWVQDFCGAVKVKGVNINDTVAANNSYVWLDQNSNYTIYGQYLTTSNMTEQVQITNSAGCIGTAYDFMPESQLKNPTYDSVITVTGGTGSVCNGSTRTYTIAPENGVTYGWTVPTGATITSGQGTRSINVTYGSTFNNGSITATKSTQCGSVSRSNPVTKGTVPAKPSVITGTAIGLCGATNKKFTVTNVANIIYNWTVPAAATIVGGQGTNQLTVNFPSTNFNGTIAVTATNSCATSAARTLSVKAIPATPAAINGPTTVCPGTSANAYSIAAVPGATQYTWTGPSGSHITANGTTSVNNILTTTATNVSIQYGTVTSTSTLKVKATNACGSGSTKSITLTPCGTRFAEQESQIKNLWVYPNPANEYLTINFEAVSTVNARVAITDLAGRKWMENDFTTVDGINQYKLSLTSLAQGTYILMIMTTEGQQAIQIVKE